MKNYESLEIKVEMLDSSDIIATSAEVTTESIALPWQTGASEQNSGEQPAVFNLSYLINQ